MRTDGMNKWYRRCVLLATGGVTLGILQGFSLVSFASLFTQFLATWLSALVSVLLGGDASQFIDQM